jgi:anti-sigma regulatory factor (Ser/Thr protein kinase)
MPNSRNVAGAFDRGTTPAVRCCPRHLSPGLDHAIGAASERGLGLAAAAQVMANLEAATARHHYQSST